MIGQIVGALTPRRHVDQPPKRVGRVLQTFWRVLGMKIKNGASIGLPGPWQKALLIFLDQSNGAVNQFNVVLSKILPDFRKKATEGFAGNIDLSDDLSRRMLCMPFLIDRPMVVYRVKTHLVCI